MLRSEARRAIRIGLVAAVALGLRLASLDRSELWFDEAYTALVATSSPGEILTELRSDSSPPLYYFLLHGWCALFGASPFVLRLFSVLWGVVAIFLLHLLARELELPKAGFWAALLLAISPLHLYYSQEARPYALFLALVLVTLLFLERMRRSSSLSGALLFSLAAALALYTHNYGVFLLGPLALYAVLRWIPPRWAASCLALIALAYAPWIPLLWNQVRTGAAGWVEGIWRGTPPALALFKSLAAFTVGGASPQYVDTGSASLSPWMHVAAYVLFGGLALSAWLRSREARLAAIGVLALLGIPFAISFFFPLYVVGRYDLLALPLFLLLVAIGLASLPRASLFVAVTAVGLLASVSLDAYYTRTPLEGVVTQAEVVARFAGPGDAVLCTGFTRNPLEYYVGRSQTEIPFYSYPTSTARHRGWIDEDELRDPRRLADDARLLVDELARRLEPTDRLWLVHSRLLAESGRFLIDSLESTFRLEPCPGNGEAYGMTCWRRAAGREAAGSGRGEHREEPGRL